MIIQVDDVRSCASNLLKVLESQRVGSTQDLGTLVNRGYKVGPPSLDIVSFDKRPSNLGTMAYAIDYY